jgi:RNA polymerase sigma-70 factor (ECF subfamily)
MSAGPASSTDHVLLGRLRDLRDERAWQDFVARYTPRIYGWCRKHGLQDADARDVTQTVLGNVVRGLHSYDPRRGFRKWLKAVTHNAWADFVHASRRGRGTGDTEVLRLLARVEGRDDLVRELDAEFERELFEEAMARVRSRVDPTTWQAFQLVVFQELPGDEVAARLGLKVGAVYAARHRVRTMLQQEVRNLDAPDGEDRS